MRLPFSKGDSKFDWKIWRESGYFGQHKKILEALLRTKRGEFQPGFAYRKAMPLLSKKFVVAKKEENARQSSSVSCQILGELWGTLAETLI